MKAVIFDAGRVLLLKNGRDEWELPGGRLEQDETPEECVEREVFEETGLTVEVESPVRSWVFEVVPGKHVFVVAYGCRVESFDGLRISDEHTDMGYFSTESLEDIPLPEGYVRAVRNRERVSD